ncbi:MAG: hypothetical protein ACRD2J_06245 [Thermoanaerobaculia bacterium]
MFRAAFFVAALAAAPALAQTAEWVHFEVTERDHRPSRVRVTLPVSAVLEALPRIPRVRLERCDLSIGRERISAEELREMLADVAAAEPGATIRRERHDHTIEVRADAGAVHIVLEDHWDDDRVEVTLPQAVASALVAESRLALAGAVRALAAAGGGELALVTADDDTRVRVWVDRSARAEEE